jgi:hypothetical protein
MADNVQTAAEWGQVIDNLDLTKKSVLTQITGVNANIQTYNNQLRTLSSQLSNADLAGDTALMAVIQGQIDTLNRRIDGANLALSNLIRDVNEIDQDLNNAVSQQATALAGPPIDNSTTLPASGLPGDPTDVTLTPQPSELTTRAILTTGQNPNITDETRANAANFIAQNFPQTTTGVVPVEEPVTEILTDPEFTTFYENDGTASNDMIDNPSPSPAGTYYDEQLDAATVDAIEAQRQAEVQAYEAQDQAAYQAALDGLVAQDQAALNNSFNGLTAAKLNTNSQGTQQDVTAAQDKRDWRVVLSLAPGATYLYKNKGNEGILLPLVATDGVLFPYTPQVSVTYAANYDPTELVHSNYKIYQYRGSSVDQISITCDFTAQDTFEANYLLAVIHFFRSATKMFYGKDKKPNIGSPPPLCYLNGLGTFQFNNHPLVITSFNYSLPSDVDYIRATNTTTNAGVNKSLENVPDNSISLSAARIAAANLLPKTANWNKTPAGTIEPTYVPTKMQIQISAVPVVARNDISNRFSLTDYATGNLLRGRQNSSGGIW